jgi:Flp pilus assembly protein TadG
MGGALRIPDGAGGARESALRALLCGLPGSEQGTELVEFSLVACLLFTCIFGIMGIANALYTYHFTCYAAREATRYGMVRGSTWHGTSCASTTTQACDATSANIISMVQTIVPPGLSTSLLTVTPTWTGAALSGTTTTCDTSNGSNGPGCVLQVKVSYSFSYGLPFLPASALTFSSTSKVIILE